MQCNDVIAFEAAAALDAYEEQLLALHRSRLQPHRIALLQAQLRRVCGCCMGLPQLAGASVDLLLAHHRLLADLGCREPTSECGARAPGLNAVVQCVKVLQRRCRGLFIAPHLH